MVTGSPTILQNTLGVWPVKPNDDIAGLVLASVTDLNTSLEAADCTMIVTDHTLYDWTAIQERAALLVDTRNALARMSEAVAG